MKLSDGEKLMLLMMCDVYEATETRGEFDPGFIRSAIFNDHTWGLHWKYSGIPFEDRGEDPVVSEVVDILDMWSFIEESYSKTTAEEKERIGQECPYANTMFPGFDGNNEPHYGVASFMVNDLGRFSEFAGRDLNSHHQVVDAYKRMLLVFEPIRIGLIGRGMTVDELILVLQARNI